MFVEEGLRILQKKKKIIKTNCYIKWTKFIMHLSLEFFSGLKREKN